MPSPSLSELEEGVAGGCGEEEGGRAPFPMVRTIVERLRMGWKQLLGTESGEGIAWSSFDLQRVKWEMDRQP